MHDSSEIPKQKHVTLPRYSYLCTTRTPATPLTPVVAHRAAAGTSESASPEWKDKDLARVVSASAIINLSMVSIIASFLSTLHASANRILRCEANAYFIGSGYASSLSFSLSGCRPRFSCLTASPLNARAHTLPLLNQKKKTDCSQSRWEVKP